MNKNEDLRVRKTKANLYKALIELMEEKSFEDIKVIDICRVSLINRSTFYDHFNDKYELLNSFMNDLKNELIIHLSNYKNTQVDSIKEYFMIIVKELFLYLSKIINTYSILSIIKKNYNSVAHDMMFEAAYNSVCEELNEHCINHSNISNENIALFYVSGVITLLASSIKNPNNVNEDKILDELDKLIPELDYLELKK